jgi:hypothetical protein
MNFSSAPLLPAWSVKTFFSASLPNHIVAQTHVITSSPYHVGAKNSSPLVPNMGSLKHFSSPFFKPTWSPTHFSSPLFFHHAVVETFVITSFQMHPVTKTWFITSFL